MLLWKGRARNASWYVCALWKHPHRFCGFNSLALIVHSQKHLLHSTQRVTIFSPGRLRFLKRRFFRQSTENIASSPPPLSKTLRWVQEGNQPFLDCVPGPTPSAQQPCVTLAVDGDRWMAFHCSPRLARILQAIRREINKMIACSISAASRNDTLFHYHSKLIEIVNLLLTLPVQQPLPTTPW